MSDYFDLVTYVKDSSAFLAEAEVKLSDKVIYTQPTDLDDTSFIKKAISLQITKTATIRNRGGSESLSVVRVNALELAELKSFTTLVILSEVPMCGDYLANMSKTNRTIYDRIHNQTPYSVMSADGGTQTITPSAFIGGLA